MRIVNVGNAGVYLANEKHSMLIDGLYGVNEFFHDRPHLLLEAAAKRTHYFRNIDNLLFTHRHQDHFDGALVNEYIRNNSVSQVYVPAASSISLPYEDAAHIEEGGRTALFSIGDKEEEIFENPLHGDMRAVFFKTCHLGSHRFSVRHYSLALIEKGKSYLFMGDADWKYSVRDVQQIIKGTILKAVFVTPLAYLDRLGKEWLRALRPESVFIYHIPYMDTGKTGIRALADSIGHSSHRAPWHLHILKDRLQQVIIP